METVNPIPTELSFKHEMVAVGTLTPHPQNYRKHPEDQLQHIKKSIEEFGFYRNIVVALDSTILAGHGVVEAAKSMGIENVPIIRLNLQPEDRRAIKIMIGDNEISHLAENDDRLLSNLLKTIKDDDTLLGTGYDERMLANLLFVTRPIGEIRDINEAAEWVGMPAFELETKLKLSVTFSDDAARQDFAQRLGIELTEATKTLRWPVGQREDLASVEYGIEGGEE